MNQMKFLPVFILFLGQSLLSIIGFNIAIYFVEKTNNLNLLWLVFYTGFSFLAVIIMIAGIYVSRKIFHSIYKEAELSMQQENMDNIEQLINTLRAQRHDFLNHVQVIYGYTSLGKIEEIQKFIEGMNHDIDRVNCYIKTDNLSIGALLMAKSAVAETRKIKIQCNIKGELKDIPMPSWELTRILGNLINNAMDAVQDLPPENRHIEVNLQQNTNGFLFQVCNLGNPIPPVLLDKVFKPGFTTKGDKGSGMGLYIVRDLVEKYNGTVDVMSTIEEGTVFNVILSR